MSPKALFLHFIIVRFFLFLSLYQLKCVISDHPKVPAGFAGPDDRPANGSYGSPAASKGQIDYSYYDNSCPRINQIVRKLVIQALLNDTRIGASLLRLHFLDCFGCDASILLDDTVDFKGEKNAFPIVNSARGYEVIDNIKSIVEESCPSTVSCADILVLAARDSVLLAGGPAIIVPLGRQDGLTASESAAIKQLPSPSEPFENIIAKFASKGLDLRDLVALSGAHTIGLARCSAFNGRLYNFKGSGKPDPTMSSSALSHFRGMCPNKDVPSINLAPLDWGSSYNFDNAYYGNLVNNSGLLESDQALLADPRTAGIVLEYSTNRQRFFSDFATSMVKLSKLGGNDGQIRKKCRSVN